MQREETDPTTLKRFKHRSYNIWGHP